MESEPVLPKVDLELNSEPDTILLSSTDVIQTPQEMEPIVEGKEFAPNNDYLPLTISSDENELNNASKKDAADLSDSRETESEFKSPMSEVLEPAHLNPSVITKSEPQPYKTSSEEASDDDVHEKKDSLPPMVSSEKTMQIEAHGGKSEKELRSPASEPLLSPSSASEPERPQRETLSESDIELHRGIDIDTVHIATADTPSADTDIPPPENIEIGENERESTPLSGENEAESAEPISPKKVEDKKPSLLDSFPDEFKSLARKTLDAASSTVYLAEHAAQFLAKQGTEALKDAKKLADISVDRAHAVVQAVQQIYKQSDSDSVQTVKHRVHEAVQRAEESFNAAEHYSKDVFDRIRGKYAEKSHLMISKTAKYARDTARRVWQLASDMAREMNKSRPVLVAKMKTTEIRSRGMVHDILHVANVIGGRVIETFEHATMGAVQLAINQVLGPQTNNYLVDYSNKEDEKQETWKVVQEIDAKTEPKIQLAHSRLRDIADMSYKAAVRSQGSMRYASKFVEDSLPESSSKLLTRALLCADEAVYSARELSDDIIERINSKSTENVNWEGLDKMVSKSRIQAEMAMEFIQNYFDETMAQEEGVEYVEQPEIQSDEYMSVLAAKDVAEEALRYANEVEDYFSKVVLKPSQLPGSDQSIAPFATVEGLE